MREILFRGKTHKGEWVYGSLLIEYGWRVIEGERQIDHRIRDLNGRCACVDPTTVGQYTGLTDKNGKKIFEGDIISIMFESDGVDGFSSYTWYESAEVVFSEEKHAWIVVFNDGGEEMYLNEYDDIDDVWVIGNIHDDPNHPKEEQI